MVFGIVLRNLERANMERNGKFDYIWDAFWVIIIIMLTSKHGFANNLVSWIWRYHDRHKHRETDRHLLGLLGISGVLSFHRVHE